MARETGGAPVCSVVAAIKVDYEHDSAPATVRNFLHYTGQGEFMEKERIWVNRVAAEARHVMRERKSGPPFGEPLLKYGLITDHHTEKQHQNGDC